MKGKCLTELKTACHPEEPPHYKKRLPPPTVCISQSEVNSKCIKNCQLWDSTAILSLHRTIFCYKQLKTLLSQKTLILHARILIHLWLFIGRIHNCLLSISFRSYLSSSNKLTSLLVRLSTQMLDVYLHETEPVISGHELWLS